MVTMGLSTISVVTSILIVRLSGVSRPLPGWLRRGAFRMIARAMCMQLPASSKSTVAPQPTEGDLRAPSASKIVADRGIIDLEEANKRHVNDSRNIGYKIDNVLNELRKVS